MAKFFSTGVSAQEATVMMASKTRTNLTSTVAEYVQNVLTTNPAHLPPTASPTTAVQTKPAQLQPAMMEFSTEMRKEWIASVHVLPATLQSSSTQRFIISAKPTPAM